jgi:UDP-3-O-[3-hydroxymyristoyl] glucosamine N-acyltransferase
MLSKHVWVEHDVIIGRNARLHAGVMIYAGARIGDDFEARAHAVIRGCARIGNRVMVGEGAVIGEDPFLWVGRGDGTHLHAIGNGIVEIGDDVQIGAHAVIEAVPLGRTWIANGVKIGAHAEVGHGSAVGAHTILCAQVGLAGNTVLGEGVVAKEQAGFAGHMQIGDRAVLEPQTGICGDLQGGRAYRGMPAIESSVYLRAYEALRELARYAGKWRAMRGISRTQSPAGSDAGRRS